MKSIILFIPTLLILSLFSCKSQESITLSSIYVNDAKSEIMEVMKMQEDAWNDGDIKQFMEGYWKSDKLRFVGRNITYGWNETYYNYQKGYPNKEIMGKLSFEIMDIDVISTNAAVMLGRYTLVRALDEPTGLFTLVWKKIDGKWLITSDMTCG